MKKHIDALIESRTKWDNKILEMFDNQTSETTQTKAKIQAIGEIIEKLDTRIGGK